MTSLHCPCALQLRDSQDQLTAGLLDHDVAAAEQGEASVPAQLLPRTQRSSIDGSAWHVYGSPAWEITQEAVLPVVILLLGVGFSIAALWVAVSAFLPN
jgi:hypothetical protein